MYAWSRAQALRLPVGDVAELGLYVLDGSLDLEGGTPLAPGALAVLTSGSQITLTAAKDKRTDVALIGGAPVQGAILFSGPFVMDTPSAWLKPSGILPAEKWGGLRAFRSNPYPSAHDSSVRRYPRSFVS